MDARSRSELLRSFAVQAATRGALGLARELADRASSADPEDTRIGELRAAIAVESGAYADAAAIAADALASGRTASLEYLRCEAVRRDGRPAEAMVFAGTAAFRPGILE